MHDDLSRIERNYGCVQEYNRRMEEQEHNRKGKRGTCSGCAKYFRDAHNLCILAEMDVVDGLTKCCDDYVDDSREE